MVDLLDDELKNITGLFKGTDYVFYEVYNPYNGKADGGWQYGHHWESCINQTWCATGYIGAMLYGVMGMKITENSISFSPCVPYSLYNISVEGLTVGGSKVDILITGSGSEIEKVVLNGRETELAVIERNTECCRIEIFLKG